MSAETITARGRKYLEASAALRKMPGEWTVLIDMLFEMAVLEAARADGRPSPHEAKFRRAWTVEAIRLGVPPEVIRILGS